LKFFRFFGIRIEIDGFFAFQYEALVKFSWATTSTTASCAEVLA
jgi:hypothetical protein